MAKKALLGHPSHFNCVWIGENNRDWKIEQSTQTRFKYQLPFADTFADIICIIVLFISLGP